MRAGAAQPKARLRVLLPFRSAPDLGAHCLREGGWRVVKQLLLMSHGPRRMPADATGTAAFLPSADGRATRQGKLEPRWQPGVWVGKLDLTDEHLLLTPRGLQRARAIQRKVDAEAWDGAFLATVRGLPWSPYGVLSKAAPGLAGPSTIAGAGAAASSASKEEDRQHLLGVIEAKPVMHDAAELGPCARVSKHAQRLLPDLIGGAQASGVRRLAKRHVRQ